MNAGKVNEVSNFTDSWVDVMGRDFKKNQNNNIRNESSSKGKGKPISLEAVILGRQVKEGCVIINQKVHLRTFTDKRVDDSVIRGKLKHQQRQRKNRRRPGRKY